MSNQTGAGSGVTERTWLAATLALSGAVMLITIWCLVQDTTTVFMHLYYIPIVLLAYHYRRTGIVFCILLSLFYVGSTILFGLHGQAETQAALLQAVIFVAIAVLVAYLAENLAAATQTERDISEIRQGIVQNANVWLMVLDRNGRIHEWNRAAEEISGYPAAEVLGKNSIWRKLYPDREYRKEITAKIAEIIATNNYLENLRTTITCRDGSRKIVLWNTKELPRGTPGVPQYIAVGVDVTERERAETALRESEEKFRLVVENAPEAIFIQTEERFAYVNPEVCRLLGAASPGEILGREIAGQFHPAFREIVRQRIRQLNIERRPVARAEEVILKLDGTPVDVEVSASPVDYAGSSGALVFMRDITEKKESGKRIRELLRVQEAQVRIINSSPAVAFLWKAEEDWPVEMVSGNVSQFGYVPEDFLLGRIPYSSVIHPDDRTRIGSEVRNNSASHVDDYTQEYRLIGKDGRIFWVIDYTHIRRDPEGTITHYEGIILDITRRRQIEDALRESDEKVRLILNSAAEAIYGLDRHGRCTFCNNACLRLLGYRNQDELLGKNMHLQIHARHADGTPFPVEECRIFRAFQNGEGTHADDEVLWRADGTSFPAEYWSYPQLRNGMVTGAVVTFIDITDRKKAEESIRESQQRMADIISFLPDPTFVIDRNGTVLAWNRALETLSGIPAAEMNGKGNFEYSIWQYGKRRPILINLVLDPDTDAARMHYTNIRQEGSVISAETEIVQASGKRVPLSVVASPLFDSRGEPTGAIESIRDITRIKEAEAELGRMNESLEKIVKARTEALEEEVVQRTKAEQDVQAALDYTRRVIEANPDLMVVLDEKGTILDVNTAGEKLTGIPARDLIGKPYFGFLEDDGTVYSAFERLKSEERLENFVRIRRTDGHLTPLSVHATVIHGTGDPGYRIIVSAHDITRQKADEEAIRASLNEKVLLLREIHHRVKNNLQIIISLTNLQMRTLDDPEMKQIMAETRNRVRAMSIVHEKLYMSENISSIDLADYTKFLASQLFSFYGVDHQKVALDIDIEKIPLDINTAIPLGLILNELISNALKHAFPGTRTGTLGIVGRVEDNRITLIVRDDGAGMSDGFDWKNSESLGLRLINSLAEQLNGTIEKEAGPGTIFIIRLHRKPIEGSA